MGTGKLSDHTEPTEQPEFFRPTSAAKPRMFGLLGGVASGKSAVAAHLGRLGAGILDADRAAHEVLTWPEVVDAIRLRWGEQVLTPEGAVNRKAVAEIVFARSNEGAAERAFLEQLTHPRIGQYLAQRLQELTQAKVPAIVVDAPLLLRAGWEEACDRLIFVDAPREVRLARATARGWTEQEFAAREAAQESLDAKRSLADVVIDNSASELDTIRQIEAFWNSEIG